MKYVRRKKNRIYESRLKGTSARAFAHVCVCVCVRACMSTFERASG